MNEYATIESIPVERLISGDRQAFTALVDLTSPKIYSLGLHMLNSEQDAEDVLQETYIKAFKALPNFEGRSSILTWLYRIASNEALMILRKRKNAGTVMELENNTDERDEPIEIVDWRGLPESELLSTETRAKMQDAVDHLSPALRMVFVLRDIQGLSGKETADILKVNENAVKTRLVRARLKLREELSEYFHERMAREV